MLYQKSFYTRSKRSLMEVNRTHNIVGWCGSEYLWREPQEFLLDCTETLSAWSTWSEDIPGIEYMELDSQCAECRICPCVCCCWCIWAPSVIAPFVMPPLYQILETYWLRSVCTSFSKLEPCLWHLTYAGNCVCIVCFGITACSSNQTLTKDGNSRVSIHNWS